MKKYLHDNCLSQSRSNRASNTQSFKGASTPKRNNGWKQLLLLFLFVGAMLSSYAQTTITTSGAAQTTTGPGSWLCPTGVTSVTVECWGAGGAGGGSVYVSTSSSNCNAAGGGAGGSYVKYTVTVSPGTTYYYLVGAGGTAASGAVGGNGGFTYFGTLSTISASTSLATATSTALVLATGGAGGNFSNGIGTYVGTGNAAGNKFIGGVTGGTGSNTGNIPSSGYTANSPGTNGATSTGGTQATTGVVGGAGYSGAGGAGAGLSGSSGGGAGGTQVNNSGTSTVGVVGTAPGGGGSGSSSGKANKAGGNGAAGQITLTWSAGVTVNDPASFTATAASNSQINLAATANGNGNNIVVVYSTTNSFSAPTNGSAAPSSGSSYLGGTVFFNGAASSLGNQTGLTSGTPYYYKAFSYDGSNNFSAGLTATATTNSSVSNPATFTATAASTSQINLSASANGNGNSIVVVSSTSAITGSPTNGSAAPSSGSWTGGPSGTVIYNGTASGLSNQTGLLASTAYYYEAYSFDGSNNFSGGLTANATTSAVAAPVSFSATVDGTNGSSQIDLSATANGAGNNIVVVFNTANSFTTPTNGTAAPSSGSFAGGTVFYKGTASGLGNQGSLSSGQIYYYEAFSYDGNNYFSAAATANATTTVATPTVSNLSPSSVDFNGVTLGSTLINVTGTNFISTSVVKLNGSATGVTTTYVSSTQLRAQITSATIAALTPSSTNSISVSTGASSSGNQTLTVSLVPNLTGIVPAVVQAGSTAKTIDVYGSNFISTSSVTWGGSATGINTTYVNSTHLTAVIPASNLLATGATAIGVSQTQLSATNSSSTLNLTVATVVSSYTTAGNYVWSNIDGVSSVIVSSWGAGGGGGFGAAQYQAGGSGAGGSFIQSTVSVPASSYKLTVGAGGAKGYTSDGTAANTFDAGAGGSSYFGNTTAGIATGATVLAVGGNGGFSSKLGGGGTVSAFATAAGGAAVSTGNTTTGSVITSIYGGAGSYSFSYGVTTNTVGVGYYQEAGGNGANGGIGGAGAFEGSTNVGNGGTAPGGGGSGGFDKTGSYAGGQNAFGGIGADGQVVISYNLAPAITNSTLTASGVVGAAVTTYTITGSNVPTSFNAVIASSGAALSTIGLAINTTTGDITGTPTCAAGSYNITISATNNTGTGTNTLAYTIAVLPGITSSLTPTFVVGTNSTYTLSASNGPIHHYTLVSGSLAGTGLTFNTSGTISGTPSSGKFGTYPLSIMANNDASGNASGDGPASTVTVTILDVPTTSSLSPTDALYGGSSFTLTVVGSNFASGLTSVTWNGSSSGVSNVTVVDATHLTATINASLIAAAYKGNTAQIGVTVSGVSTASGTQPFIIDNLNQDFTTVGNNTWVCPPGVTSVTVKAWGGGGAGGGTASSYNVGGGGAGGSFVEYVATVVPGTTYNLTVGTGGTGLSAGNGNVGGSSYFGNTTAGNSSDASVLATGGAGGIEGTGTNSSSSFGAGFFGGTGSTSGNKPTSGAFYNFPGISGGISVGGGSGTARSGAGGAGAGPNGSADGGAGGASVTSSGSTTTGNTGSVPGGGGSGASSPNSSAAGGAGAKGEISLIYNAAPIINSSLTSSVLLSQSFSYSITVNSTVAASSFSASGLTSIPGTTLSCDPTTGVISGTIANSQSAVGVYNITINATNGAGTGSATLQITVNDPAAPSITSGVTASGIVGVYASNLYQVAGTATSPATIASYSATISSPSAAALSTIGLAINSSNGIIFGTPNTSGSYGITVTATDNYGSHSSKTVTLTIATAPNYYYSGSGALNDYHNWYTSTNGSGIQAPSSVFTQASTSFNILTTTTTANDGGSAWSVTGSSSVINVGSASTSGVTLTIANGDDIVGLVNATAASGGSNTLNIQDATIPTLNTLNAGSTVIYAGSSAQTIYNATYGNLTISNAVGATSPVSSTVIVAGTLSVNSGGKLNLGSGNNSIINLSGAAGVATVVVNGTVAFPAGYTTYISGTNATFTVNSGALIKIGDAVGIINTTASGNIRTKISASRSLSAGSYEFDASGAANTGTGLTGCNNLTINNSTGTTTLSASLDVTGSLTVTSGTLATGGHLTLKSTSIANTAVVTNVCASCAITGTATVERYIPLGYRAYRDMTPEVYGAGSMYSQWQEGGKLPSSSGYKAGYGIFITGSNAQDANAAHYVAGQASADAISGQLASNVTYGLDYSLNGISSANTYTNGTGFVAVSNTTSQNLDAFAGYRVLIRGDRSFNLATTSTVIYPAGLRMINATTLRATGNLVYGAVTYTTSGVTATVNGNASATLSTAAKLNTAATAFGTNGQATSGFSIVANPYVCPVSWATVYNDSKAAGSDINGTYWYLDPTQSAAGKYLAYNAVSGSNTSAVTASNYHYYGSTSGASSSGKIQPGQAFFIMNSTAATPTPKVVFNETAKLTATDLVGVFGVKIPLSKLYVSLEKQVQSSGYEYTDGTAVAFRSDFTNSALGSQDAIKFGSSSDNLFISDKGMNLSIDGRLPATATDVIALKISKPSTTNYQLKVDATDYINEGYTPELYDSYKKTTTAIASVDSLTFTVDTAVAGTYANRFSIVFSPTALPVNSIVASASLNNKVATITWNTVGEKNVARYEAEKSADAKTFTKIGQATAKNTATANYSTTENNVTATTYYRIKAVSTSGSISYSNVAKVQLTVNSNQFAVYPNPLVGKTLDIQVANVSAGKYLVSIYNVLGEKVSEQSINHEGGSASHAITISNTLARGVYNVVVREAASDKQVYQTNLSVQP